MPYAVQCFSAGVLDSSCKVVRVCERALASCEVMVHPRISTVVRPLYALSSAPEPVFGAPLDAPVVLRPDPAASHASASATSSSVSLAALHESAAAAPAHSAFSIQRKPREETLDDHVRLQPPPRKRQRTDSADHESEPTAFASLAAALHEPQPTSAPAAVAVSQPLAVPSASTTHSERVASASATTARIDVNPDEGNDPMPVIDADPDASDIEDQSSDGDGDDVIL